MALEPLYALEVACELIPCSKDVLKHILSRRAAEFDPPLWHTAYHDGTGKGNSACRMLRESECLKIRNMIIKRGKPRAVGLSRDKTISNFGMMLGIHVER